MSNVIPLARPSRSLASGLGEQQGQKYTYTVAEVAKILRLSRGLTYAAVRAGEIPAKQVGSRWVISVKTFHEWLNNSDNADREAA